MIDLLLNFTPNSFSTTTYQTNPFTPTTILLTDNNNLTVNHGSFIRLNGKLSKATSESTDIRHFSRKTTGAAFLQFLRHLSSFLGRKNSALQHFRLCLGLGRHSSFCAICTAHCNYRFLLFGSGENHSFSFFSGRPFHRQNTPFPVLYLFVWFWSFCVCYLTSFFAAHFPSVLGWLSDFFSLFFLS